MVYEILSATTFGREKKGEVNLTKIKKSFNLTLKVGISRLVEAGTFDAAFPLHDVRY